MVPAEGRDSSAMESEPGRESSMAFPMPPMYKGLYKGNVPRRESLPSSRRGVLVREMDHAYPRLPQIDDVTAARTPVNPSRSRGQAAPARPRVT